MKDESWMKSHWRPFVAFSYVAIILFDFIIGPIGWSVLHAMLTGTVATAWAPLTLGGGGLFHVAINTLLSASAYTRGKEKIARLESLDSTDEVQ